MNKTISLSKDNFDEENKISDEFRNGQENLGILLDKIKAAVPIELFMELDTGLAAYESICTSYYYEGGFKEGLNLMRACS